MATWWIWWAVAAVVVGTELLVGTFYLLAVGVAFALGGVVALLGASVPVQLVIAGILVVVLTIFVHRWRLAHAPVLPQPSFDIGQTVHVDHWRADGTARVSYRGTQWDAELATPAATPSAQPADERVRTMYIVDTRGSTLVIAPERP
jgi:membrane protein implicated in regulation of membrane protease activity